jgi:hypothetical protein
MPESTKFQANFKLADGTLLNLYADNATELETSLGLIQDLAPLVHSVSQSLTSAGPARTFTPRRSGATPTQATQAVPQQQIVEGQSPTCKHGSMTLKTGTSAKGPWKGWLCNAPKGAPDKCDPIWA